MAADRRAFTGRLGPRTRRDAALRISSQAFRAPLGPPVRQILESFKRHLGGQRVNRGQSLEGGGEEFLAPGPRRLERFDDVVMSLRDG